MTKTCWAMALCLLTASTALAQAPRGRDADADFGDDAAGEEQGERGRGERGERGERGGREFGRDGEEGRFGAGGPGGRGGMFRRSNAMFEAIDADGDGSISNAELRKAAAALKKLDADGDGQITLAEVGGGPGGPGGFGPGGPGGPGGGDMTAFVDQVMTQQDKNGDGKLTLNEVDERTAMMLSRADANGDKAIDRAELTTAMEQMRQRMGGGFGAGGPGGPAGGFGRGGAGMTERMMSFDRNGDGKLSADEVPEQARGALRGADANGDGQIDAKELEEAGRRMGGRARGVGADAGQGRGRFDRGGEDEADGAEANRRSRRGRDGEE